MFHKNTLLIYGACLGFCGFSYCFPFVHNTIVEDFSSSSWAWYLTQLLFIFEIVILFYLVSVVFVIISSHLTTVKIGRPALNNLTIAYQYGFSNTVSTSSIRSSYECFPYNDKIQICYEHKSGPFGLAHGVVIPEKGCEEVKAVLISYGYRIFRTKPVSNAIHISCPAVPWLSYFGQWLILTVIYPKLYKYSKTHRLSAYPVVELYRRFSVSLIAPLSQQDVFVVPEAEHSLNRSTRHIDTPDASMTEGSIATSYHTTRAKLSATNSATTPNRSMSLTKVSPRLSVTPLGSSYTAKIILKHSLSPVDEGKVAKSILRTSTPVEGHARGE